MKVDFVSTLLCPVGSLGSGCSSVATERDWGVKVHGWRLRRPSHAGASSSFFCLSRRESVYPSSQHRSNALEAHHELAAGQLDRPRHVLEAQRAGVPG